MPRKPLIKTDLYFYHITTRSNHREWFKLPLDEVWDICIKSFRKAQKNSPAQISQFVLMSNHYHMLIKTPDANIDRFMFWFNKTFSDELRKSSGQINRMFGSSYKWSIVYEQFYLQKVYLYIYQNPLRARIVDRCENYPYSTLYYTSRKKSPGFKFTENIFHDDEDQPVNQELTEDDLNIIRSGLKKTVFKPNSNRKY
jgi:putative transposase